MNKDAYYFPHFSNARNDRKLRRLRKELGVEGYGIYFMILEVIRDQKNFRYPMEDVDLLADEFNTSDQKVKIVVCNYGLFEVDEKERFFSPKFIEYMTPYLEGKERNRINGIRGNLIRYEYGTKDEIMAMTDQEILRLKESKGNILGGDSGGDSLSDRKESKVNESKVNESIYPFEEFWNDYDHKKERKKCMRKWKQFTESERETIKDFVPIYLAHTPDKNFRKYPYTFLNSEIWNDDWESYPPKQNNNGKSLFEEVQETQKFLSSYQE